MKIHLSQNSLGNVSLVSHITFGGCAGTRLQIVNGRADGPPACEGILVHLLRQSGHHLTVKSAPSCRNGNLNAYRQNNT